MSFSKYLIVVCVLWSVYSTQINAAQKTLDIYFIDVEGGAATLIVTPAGESLLVDSGFPGDRDAGRIAHVARAIAGLKQIDHHITTHWHRDHVGGSAQLVKLIPVIHFYDHGIPSPLSADIEPELIEAYRRTTEGKSTVLKPGDEIKMNNAESRQPLRIQVLSANGAVTGEQPGASQIRPCGPDFKPGPEDKSDNPNSVGFLLSFGRFRFFDGGDLTWNVENKLVCPKNLVGVVDVYQVDHHGSDPSINPAFINALKPRVAVIDNGPRKGAEPGAFAALKKVSELDAIYQLHRNVRTTEKDNAPPDFVANDEEACQGEFIKISVSETTRTYSVNIPAKKLSREYQVR